MNDQRNDCIGYLRYTGKDVENGLLDARKSAEALLGFDEMFRYFIKETNPTLKDLEFEIPVRIQKGSWEIFLCTSLAIYLASMSVKAGKDGLFETGLVKDVKKLIQSVIKLSQWWVKMRSHVKGSDKDITVGKMRNNNEEISILNEDNEPLWIPFEHFGVIKYCPKDILSKNASIIEEERTLEIGINENGEFNKVTITKKEKHIFYIKNNDDDEGILFPELKHEDNVKLKGTITRENEESNTLGFKYENQVLICRPRNNKKLAEFKHKILSSQENRMFPEVEMIGTIDRMDTNGDFKRKRPKIIFSDIVPIEKPRKIPTLF